MAWRRGTSVFSVIRSRKQSTTSLAGTRLPENFWFYVLQALGLQLPQGASSTLSWWRRLHALSNGQQREGMDSLFALVSWQVWKERNGRCFQGSTATINELLQIVNAEAERSTSEQADSECWPGDSCML